MDREIQTFEWDHATTNFIFPIDYSGDEYKEEFQQDFRQVKKHVLNSYLFREILLDVAPPSPGDMGTSSEHDPPVPLEAVPFLKCFYHLGKQASPGYHRAFFCNNPDPPSQPESKAIDCDIMKNFWNDFCLDLYKQTAPPQDGSTEDLNAFCRHILFQNEQFVSSLITPIWDNELKPRFETIRKLGSQVGLKEQIQALRECLISLDSTILTLQSQVQAATTSGSLVEPSPVTTSSLQELLISLLKPRKSFKESKGNRIFYNVPDVPLPKDEANTSLGTAFENIRRRQKPTEKAKCLLKRAREAYLSYLAEMIESSPENKGSLELEQKFIDLHNYLTAPLSHRFDNLSDYITESCKQYCQQVIDFCTYSPITGAANNQSPTPSPYKDDLVDRLIYRYASDTLSCFQGTLRAITYHTVGRDWSIAYNYYQMLNSSTHNDSDSADSCSEAIPKTPPESDKLIASVEPLRPMLNLFRADLISFCQYFKEAWQFLYSNTPPLFKNGSCCFENLSVIAATFWEGTRTAAQFFSKGPPLQSEEEVFNAFCLCEQILLSSNCQVSPAQFLNYFTPILLSLLLQILQKVVEDCSPSIHERLLNFPASQ